MKRMICLLLSFLFVAFVYAQDKIDVLHYQFNLELNDKNDTIYGTAEIVFTAKKGSSKFEFDLTGGVDSKKGMTVTKVILPYKYPYADAGRGNLYSHYKDKILVQAWQPLATDDTLTATIEYKGVPDDGLIISKNKYGKRTFFSDNWPNRAHHWIPCHDDPADKASVEFIVIAPSHYQIVSNGVLLSKMKTNDSIATTTWKEDIPLPTKVMVIGVADFSVDNTGEINGVPVSSWVFSDNEKKGFYDYAPAKDILAFFMNYIGPYPYKKLANVQSKTIFGGMENASAIFYFENSVNGQRKDESLLAHEIVHQWFGDMATEKSFPHLWLSEGFATYLTHIYIESKYGTDSLRKEMKTDRSQVIDFVKEFNQPVVDTVSPLMRLLNANSYQKGGWILHMLRQQLGDSIFHHIIRKYYSAYQGKNADTRDFEKICGEVAGKNLQTFFQQWLYTPGIPKLNVQCKYNERSKNGIVTVTQLQDKVFQFPLTIQWQTGSGKQQLKTLMITKKTERFTIDTKEKITKIDLDPNTSLLFEGAVSLVD